MKRTQIQIDGVRNTLNDAVGNPSRRRPKALRRLAEFPFVGSGRSGQKRRSPVSERHDDALAEALARKAR